MKTYVFPVTIEQDEDARWVASCPMLPGCATWGRTQEEALQNIREAVEVYVEDMIDAGEALPDSVKVINAPAVSVVAG